MSFFLHKTAIWRAVSGICDCHISVQCMNLYGEVWMGGIYNYMCLFCFWATAVASDGDDRVDSRLAWVSCGAVERWSGGDVRLEASEVESGEWDKVESGRVGQSGIRESRAKWNRMIWVDGRDRKRKKF